MDLCSLARQLHVPCHLQREGCASGRSPRSGPQCPIRPSGRPAHPGGIDFCSFFLDGGLCAGAAPAVRCFLSSLVDGFRLIGLEVSLDKTQIIPLCTSSSHSDPLTSLGAAGMCLPDSSFLVLLSDRSIGARVFWQTRCKGS